MRSAPEYSEMFEGIQRTDGSLRMTEAQYLQNKEAVIVHFNEFNLGGYAKENIDTVFPKLLANNVSPDEMSSEQKRELKSWKRKRASIIIITHKSKELYSYKCLKAFKSNKNVLKLPTLIRLF